MAEQSGTQAILGLFGSDVFNPYPASYSWDSNQMAHAMMGFAGVALVAGVAVTFGLPINCGLLFFVFPLGKDLIDLWVDFGRRRRIVIYRRQRRHLLAPVGDALVDQGFWWTGGGLAQFVLASTSGGDGDSLWALALAALIVALALAAGLKFRAEKARFDKSGMPYYFRLPNLDRGAEREGAAALPGPLAPAAFTRAVNDFIDAPSPRHLVVAGPARSGRTLVPVGIGCDMLSVGRTSHVRYVRWSALGELAGVGPERASDASEPWHLNEATMLIVDDVPFEPDLAGLAAGLFAARNVIWTTNRALDPRGGGDALARLVAKIDGFVNARSAGIPVDPLILAAPDGDGNDYEIGHGLLARLVAGAFVVVSATVLIASIGLLAWCGGDVGSRRSGEACNASVAAPGIAAPDDVCRRCRLAVRIAQAVGG